MSKKDIVFNVLIVVVIATIVIGAGYSIYLQLEHLDGICEAHREEGWVYMKRDYHQDRYVICHYANEDNNRVEKVYPWEDK